MITALVTPLNADQSVDEGALVALCRRQVAAGVAGLAPLGSTGEGGLLTDAERRRVLALVVDAVAGRIPVLTGTGCQSTWQTCERQREAHDLGATYGLVVTPFYCRPDGEEQAAHLRQVAAAAPLPIVAYDVPKRTGAGLPLAVVAQLAEVEGVVGLKDATGDLSRVPGLRAMAPRWRLFSGDDGTSDDFVAAGGDGVISVASNLAPRAMVAAFAAAGRPSPSPRLRALWAHLAAEANPRAIKRLLGLGGSCGATLRAPLKQPPAAAAGVEAFADLL